MPSPFFSFPLGRSEERSCRGETYLISKYVECPLALRLWLKGDSPFLSSIEEPAYGEKKKLICPT